MSADQMIVFSIIERMNTMIWLRVRSPAPLTTIRGCEGCDQH
jgi:hypothetical protein